MGFNFPATPATGEVYQPTGGPAYQWDGEKWRGGQPSGPQKEQFFDLSGKTQQDIAVPTWAKMCQIEGAVFLPAVNWTQIQVSDDGTTFKANTGDYQVAGPYHNTGTSAYTKTDAVGTYGMTVDLGGDTSIPRSFSATVTVERSGAGQVFHMRSFATTYANAAGSLYRTFWQQAYVAGAATSALRLKALRILPGGGVATFNAGSRVHVRWLGDDAQMPVSNAIPEAPQDNGEYTRVNGVWRLKEQPFDVSGISTLDIAVPTLAKAVHLDGNAFVSVATAYPVMQVSLDGTTFYAGTSYQLGGPIHATTGAYGTQAAVAALGMYLSYPRENTNVPHNFQADLNLVSTGTRLVTCRAYATHYGTNGFHTTWFQTYLNMVGPFAVKKLRVLAQGGAFAADSYLNVRWLY